MAKMNVNLETIRELHRSGNWEGAKQGYLAILRKNPRDYEALHAIGVILAQQKDLLASIEYLEKAIQYQPNDPTCQLHLANVLKMQGLYAKATTLLEKTVQHFPDYVPAFNNLGTLYYTQGQIDEAIRLYREALIKQPNYADVYYNLALALMKKNEFAEAISLLKTLLQHVPDHVAAQFHLASAYMQQGDLEAAIKEYSIITENHPHHVESQTNLASCYLKKGLLDLAKIHYIKALELTPNDFQLLFNLGYLATQQGETDAAIQYYQRAVKANPDSFAAQNNLGAAFLAKPHLGFALQHFREALRIQPDNTSVAYTIKALEQNQPLLSAPPDYVRSLFDAYADHYDMHLLKALEYQIPTLFLHGLRSILAKETNLTILDLGCGTGLCGQILKPYATQLVGVDLSANMLQVANQKNIYTELHQEDFLTFLTSKKQNYDVIIAGDVLVYMGDLSQLFELAKQALKSKGLFVFNTEITPEPTFKMNQSGRFAHNKSYLETLAAKNQFEILSYQTAKTRQQNNEPVYGHLFILRSL